MKQWLGWPRSEGLDYTEHDVQRMADALHEDCVLVANARYAIDPLPDPWQGDWHDASRHYGQAHDLVRRLLRTGKL